MGLPTLGKEHFEALDAVQGLPPTASNLSKMAARLGAPMARWAFEQWELRSRARAKFERASQMLFDREGLEMASSEPLAELHVQRFPQSVRMADLTCGIGADLIAIARNGPAIGYEIDPVRASYARHNLAVHGLEAEIRVTNCLEGDWDFDYAFADPSRRSSGIRTADPAQFSPRPDELLRRMWDLRLGAMKLSPMLSDDFLESLGGERWFHSHLWECREVMVIVGKEHAFDDGSRNHGCWAAKTGPGHPLSGGVKASRTANEPESFLFEADPAAIRAHALGDLCDYLGAFLLGDSNGYLTSSRHEASSPAAPWVRTYQVHAWGHADHKRIRAELRRLDGELDAVKLRGFKDEPSSWQKRLATSGSQKLVLILYPVGKSRRFVLAEPLYR